MLVSSRRGVAVTAALAITVLLAACSSAKNVAAGATTTPSAAAEGGMPNGEPGEKDIGDGRASSKDGYQLVRSGQVPSAGQAARVRFRIIGSAGKAVTAFASNQTQLMHFYLVRSDLTDFQHVHPRMAKDGTWTVDLAPLQPGVHRMYASFVAVDTGKNVELVLGDAFYVAGTAVPVPLPAPAQAVEVDGYRLTFNSVQFHLHQSGNLTVTFTKDGTPVNDLQPYLGSYAHVTAIHEDDLTFAHIHPMDEVKGDRGGPTLTLHAELERFGNWRLFIEFQTAGTLHTAVVTLSMLP
jgi:hypothetical protein